MATDGQTPEFAGVHSQQRDCHGGAHTDAVRTVVTNANNAPA